MLAIYQGYREDSANPNQSQFRRSDKQDKGKSVL